MTDVLDDGDWPSFVQLAPDDVWMRLMEDPVAVVRSGVVPPHLEMTVVGMPAPQGSKRSVGKVMIESSKAVKPWRENVQSEAERVCGFEHETGRFSAAARVWPLRGPLIAMMVFTMPKPGTKAKKKHRTFAESQRNDVSKLCRSTEDALVTAQAIQDDGLIVEYVRLSKVFPGEDPDALALPGARIRVWSIEELMACGSVESGEHG